MPKDKRVRSSPLQSRKTPYSSNLKNANLYKSRDRVVQDGDLKEWEEARCPICMEHPHNAILLVCSSYNKGCRPFMCDTSYRHSNCFDQFSKSLAANLPGALLGGGVPPSNTSSQQIGSRLWPEEENENQVSRGMIRWLPGKEQQELVCPLCRGQVKGSIVVEPARQLMNSKPRTCSLETCNFSGTYSELRKHARVEHPSVRPSDVDSRRQHDWTKLERERDFQDMFSALHTEIENDRNEDQFLNMQDLSWLENEMELEGIFEPNLEESEDEWLENGLVMDNELELPFSFLGELYSLLTNTFLETDGSGGSGSSGLFHPGISRARSAPTSQTRTGYTRTTTRTANRMETDPTVRRNNGGPRQRDRSQGR